MIAYLITANDNTHASNDVNECPSSPKKNGFSTPQKESLNQGTDIQKMKLELEKAMKDKKISDQNILDKQKNLNKINNDYQKLLDSKKIIENRLNLAEFEINDKSTEIEKLTNKINEFNKSVLDSHQNELKKIQSELNDTKIKLKTTQDKMLIENENKISLNTKVDQLQSKVEELE
jgi:chromosome segregation ATPase